MTKRFSPFPQITLNRRSTISLLTAGVLLFSSQLSLAQFTQQGPKLADVTAPGAGQGKSVALSADGNTALVGGPQDHNFLGAAWVYVRNNSAWVQQGSKLLGNNAIGDAVAQGWSVALSSDGNTALVGGIGDSSLVRYGGAVWVYTRENGVWTQQGNKLFGRDGVGPGNQGTSVALSADGNTAIFGGPGDDTFMGAAWVFTRNSGVWTQQGKKLVGSGAVGMAKQGSSVALSADGNIAVVGGTDDNSFTGAVWIFTRNNGIWTEQGNKVVGNGFVGSPVQGTSVALSADGNTMIVGGPGDSSKAGAAWVFTRNNGVWVQQGNKLVGNGALEMAMQGSSVALSADGNTALVGGPGVAQGGLGVTWVYTRQSGIWTQQDVLVGSGAVGGDQGESVAISADSDTSLVGASYDNDLRGAAWVFVRPAGQREQRNIR
jgi:hypothetical protein